MVARGRNPAVPRRTLSVGGYSVVTTVTARPGVARRWLYNALWCQRQQLHTAAGLTVGLGMQWTPPFHKLPGGGVEKPRRIGTSTWDGPRLSRGQVRYACVDAFLSRCLGEHIRRDMERDDDYDDGDGDSMDGEESEPDAVDGGYWA